MSERAQELTRLLRADGIARGELLPLVYDELRGIAEGRMGGERGGHTLQATALVHEAYMRLLGDQDMSWRSRGHFYGAAAEAMRRILIDHARRVRSKKRGGDLQRVTLGAPVAEGGQGSGGARGLAGQGQPGERTELSMEEVLALDEALERLQEEDPRAAEVTRLRFFSGLSVAETALAMGISERSVHREWTFARARLFELMSE